MNLLNNFKNFQPISIYYSKGILKSPPNGIKKIFMKLSHFFPPATPSQTGIGNKVTKINGAHKREINQSPRKGMNPTHEYKS